MTRFVGYRDLGRHGRLANIMFQIASTVGIARSRGMEPVFDPPGLVYRPIWCTPDEWWPELWPADVTPASTLAPHLSRFAATYLQDLSLFDNAEAEVRSVLSLSSGAEEQLGEYLAVFDGLVDPCVVHVRRGDTATRNPPGTINPLPVDYYLRAVESCQPGSVVVFTDDPVWCRTRLPGDWVVHHGEPGPEDHEPDYHTRPRRDWLDMYAMSVLASRGSIVLSNSVFGWWAAWMSRCEHVRVPSRWFGPRLAPLIDIRRILLPHWQVVQTR